MVLCVKSLCSINAAKQVANAYFLGFEKTLTEIEGKSINSSLCVIYI